MNQTEIETVTYLVEIEVPITLSEEALEHELNRSWAIVSTAVVVADTGEEEYEEPGIETTENVSLDEFIPSWGEENDSV